jgi:archaellum component FlaC
MSTLGDALSALRSVVLMEDRLSRVEQDMAGMASDMSDLKTYMHEIDKRVVRIETMIEMTARTPRQPPQLGIEEQ